MSVCVCVCVWGGVACVCIPNITKGYVPLRFLSGGLCVSVCGFDASVLLPLPFYFLLVLSGGGGYDCVVGCLSVCVFVCE